MLSWLRAHVDVFASTTWIAIWSAIGLAIWKYFYELRQKKRENLLGRVNQQLKELYGPLYALVEATKQSRELLYKRVDADVWERNS